MEQILLIFIIGLIAIFLLYSSNKEGFTGFSSFRSVGRKNKKICQNYYLGRYLECVKNSGGRDVQGNCWNRIKPHLIACHYTDF